MLQGLYLYPRYNKTSKPEIREASLGVEVSTYKFCFPPTKAGYNEDDLLAVFGRVIVFEQGTNLLLE